jgi:hypothetical protein
MDEESETERPLKVHKLGERVLLHLGNGIYRILMSLSFTIMLV